MRTFSKAFGLAGCRAGYLISNKRIAKKLFSLKPMYEINSLATIIIENLLKNNTDKLYSRETEKGKKYLINFLKKKIINSLIQMQILFTLILENTKKTY